MRKIKDVLRLRHEMGLGQRQIARSCAIAQATVVEYLKRAEAAGIGWPLPQDWERLGWRKQSSARQRHRRERASPCRTWPRCESNYNGTAI